MNDELRLTLAETSLLFDAFCSAEDASDAIFSHERPTMNPALTPATQWMESVGDPLDEVAQRQSDSESGVGAIRGLTVLRPQGAKA